MHRSTLITYTFTWLMFLLPRLQLPARGSSALYYYYYYYTNNNNHTSNSNTIL